MRAAALSISLAAVGAAACTSPAPAAPEADIACAAAPGWRHERIELPPEFAPDLPAGVETLYFAPRMFEPGAPGYWSYVFSLELSEPGPTDAAALASLLERYYTGLIAAVAAAKKRPPPGEAAVEVNPLGGGRFAARIATVDAFTTGEAIGLRLEVRATPSCLDVAASVAPETAPIWSELASARRCVACGRARTGRR